MENVGLKRKTDDEIARERRRERFMGMEAKNKLRKLNYESSSFNENPIISDDSSHSHEELDLNLSLAPPGQCSNSNNNSNSISSASSYITSISCAGDTFSKKSQVKKPRKSTSSVPVAVPVVAVVGANDGVDWPIMKQLSESDVTGRQNRLFVEKKNVPYITDKLDEEEKKTVSEGGFQIPVVDTDTGELKRLKFSYWKSTKSYILNGEWQTKFVDQRGLKEKDTVGLRWDDNVENCDRRLIFSVLSRATTPSNPNESSQEVDNLSNPNVSSQGINTPSNSNQSSQEINTQ